MVDPELAQRQLEALKRKGFRLSIDDFGTGHSSLSYVHRFPVDRIKVDRSFLLRARTEHETDVVMRAIIDLGLQLGLEVVAEGVETDVELAKLQLIGCKLVRDISSRRRAPATACRRSSGVQCRQPSASCSSRSRPRARRGHL